MRGLRLAMNVDPALHPLWTRLFPNAEIVMVPDYRTLPDFSKVDAAIWTLEQAAAFARSIRASPRWCRKASAIRFC